MRNWKDIGKLSSKQEKDRESAFEAAMLTELAHEKPPKKGPPPPGGTADTVAISVTQNGKTTTYHDLDTVPPALRQRILNAWSSKPAK
jgi:hypothetical protein